MPDQSDLLNTEQALQELLVELNKLKSAAEQIEDTKNGAKAILESTERIVSTASDLVSTGQAILTRMGEIEFKERLDKVDQLVTDSIDKSQTVLNRFEEVRFQERFDTVAQMLANTLKNGQTLLSRFDDAKFQERLGRIEQAEWLMLKKVENFQKHVRFFLIVMTLMLAVAIVKLFIG